jgi:hypothetical protein
MLPLVSWYWLPYEARPTTPVQSCAAHLRGPEREFYDAAKAAMAAREEASEARFRAAKPACWSWPVPDDLDTWEAPQEFSVGPGEFEVPQSVADDLMAIDRTPEGRARALLSWWQDGRCAVCGVRGMHLAEDHDHVSGLVRGYLCRSCNTREGLNREENASPFARYRVKHPTTILGLELRYWDPFTKDYAPDHCGDPKRDPWDPDNNALIGIGL